MKHHRRDWKREGAVIDFVLYSNAVGREARALLPSPHWAMATVPRPCRETSLMQLIADETNYATSEMLDDRNTIP